MELINNSIDMVGLLFLIICLLSLVLLYYATARNKKLIVVFGLWQVVIIILAVLEVFERNPMVFPGIMLLTFLVLFICLRNLDVQRFSTKRLITIHSLRIGVELILFQLFIAGKIPEIMTFKGWNFDIMVGISAVFLLLYSQGNPLKINRHIILIWNYIGAFFLLFIVIIAVLSSPIPIQQFAFEQPNLAVFMFPYCLLPTCVVPIVMLSHFFLIRKFKNNVVNDQRK